jgi:hypothetical protein
MSTVIKLKYSTVTAQPADDALQVAEPAYSYVGGGKLYIGADQAGTIVPQVVGGKYFTDMLDHTPGTLTAGSGLIVDNDSKIDQFFVDDLKFDGKTISITDPNGNLTLEANGTGSIVFASPVNLSSQINIGNLSITGNTISATNTNGTVVLSPNGTGLVSIDSDQGLKVASGTTGTRPSADYIPNGVIRYNETSNRFEGTVSGNWTGLGGVVDIDQDTYITAEEGPDDDTLRFYTADESRLTISSTGIQAQEGLGLTVNGGINVDDIALDANEININGSTISATGNSAAGAMTIDPAPAAGDNGGELIIRGNLQVTGTTTTVNSTVVEIADPVMVLGDASANDSLNRGIELKYTDDGGTTEKVGFFGWDRGADNNFTFAINGAVSDAKFNNLKLDGSIVSVDGNAPEAGQLLIGNGTNGDMELATLTEGDSVTITNTDGAIEIDVDPATAVATSDIVDTGDSVVDYTPAVDNASARGAATFASEQFAVNSGHVVITTIEGGTF